MKSKFLIGSLALFSAGAIAWAAKDPVVMTINGVDVPRSEFEYLFHKNSQQQVEAQPIEDYVGMFELYKMKVAEAKAEGIDTTASFLSEMKQYSRDLAMPYVADSVYLNKLIDEAYKHSQQELDYYIILVPKGKSAAENTKNHQLADSIHTALLNGGDFAELASKYSVSSPKRGGHIGYMASGLVPYSIDHVSYNLKDGQLSDVIENNIGYAIVKVGGRRPAKGSVRAAHILKAIRPGSTPEMEAKAKQEIDSLYAILQENPGQFEVLALNNSDDTGSARMGGQVGWFSSGVMIPEFSEKAFELEVGEISEPIKSDFGWHIIKKIDARGVRSRDEIKPELLNLFNDNRDERTALVRENRDNKLAKKHKAKVNTRLLDEMKKYVAEKGLDAEFYKKYGTSNEPLFTVLDNVTPVSAFIATFNNQPARDTFVAGTIFNDRYNNAYDNALIEAEEAWLYAKNSDYRNLLNEYRDGSLLYEVSLRNVWDKAANDNEGLEKFFQAHKEDYKFKEPRAKGFLVLAKNDSVADMIKARYPEIDRDSVVTVLRAEFKQDAVIDRLLAPAGLNRFVDKVLFNGPDPELNPRYPVYFILDARVIEEPEEMSDVKGAVTADYQQELEQNWTTELRKKYHVVRNDAELKKIK